MYDKQEKKNEEMVNSHVGETLNVHDGTFSIY